MREAKLQEISIIQQTASFLNIGLFVVDPETVNA